MDNETIITILAALGAALSFAAFAFPFLQKNDKKEKSLAIIEKRRKDLFQANRDGRMNKVIKEEDQISARDNMATFYKFQKMAGKMGEKARDKMLQAGIRNPKAHIRFMLSRVLTPIVFCLVAMLFLSIASEKKEISGMFSAFVILGASVFGFMLPNILIKNRIIKRQQELNLSFPDSLDMMLICVQGGIGLEQTIERVASEVADHSEILAEELGILSAEMAMLNDRRQALQDFARRVGSGAGKTFATALIQAEQYGTSVSQAMRVMADELRDMRMAEAERKAASLPPKLTVPMIAFFLPALFVIILGPAGLKAFG
ncbi:MAG: type II secretion system F family protein [Alphaproteobacteria bacterium]|nr:type II secretion system F family protein [Alphaproteobacteria bacterium]